MAARLPFSLFQGKEMEEERPGLPFFHSTRVLQCWPPCSKMAEGYNYGLKTYEVHFKACSVTYFVEFRCVMSCSCSYLAKNITAWSRLRKEKIYIRMPRKVGSGLVRLGRWRGSVLVVRIPTTLHPFAFQSPRYKGLWLSVILQIPQS